MLTRSVITLLLAVFGASAQPTLWTGNFTNVTWTNAWAMSSAPAGKRTILGLTNSALFVDPAAPGGGFLRITYPAGSYGSPTGGCQFYGGVLRTNGNLPIDSATLSYSVRFPSNFNFVLGGKLPGLYGGDGNTGTNFPTGTDGFTTRLMWRTNGAGEAFPFLPNSPTNNLGTSLGRGNWFFTGDNRWHQIRQDVVLNHPDASNGYVRVWHDGVLAVDAPGLFFRSTNGLKIDGAVFQTFFGGGDPEYATPVGAHADFASFSISALNEVASPVLLSNYQTTVMSQNPVYYFTFDSSLLNSATNATSAPVTLNVHGGDFHHDYFNNRSNAWFLSDANDGLSTGTDLINGGGAVPPPNAVGVGSLTMLFRTLDSTNTTRQAFIFSQGNSTASDNAFGLFVENDTSTGPNALKLRGGNLTSIILRPEQIVPARWYFFAVTWSEFRNPAEVIWYIGRVGGTLTNGSININNLAVVGDDGPFYIGNNGGLNNAFRNPGNGRVDELAIWDRELSASEISNQFNVGFAPSALSIARDGTNSVVSWPKDGRPWMVLESVVELGTNDEWVFSGTPLFSSNTLVVTNSQDIATRFYRLRDP